MSAQHLMARHRRATLIPFLLLAAAAPRDVGAQSPPRPAAQADAKVEGLLAASDEDAGREAALVQVEQLLPPGVVFPGEPGRAGRGYVPGSRGDR